MPILCNEQHGFRHARSCETKLLLTINDFAVNLNNKGQTDVILLDFSKAFDTEGLSPTSLSQDISLWY